MTKTARSRARIQRMIRLANRISAQSALRSWRQPDEEPQDPGFSFDCERMPPSPWEEGQIALAEQAEEAYEDELLASLPLRDLYRWLRCAIQDRHAP